MIALFAALTVLDALLLWAVILHRDRWWLPKLVAIGVAVAVNVLALGAYSTGSGWPAGANPPASARFIACVVTPPDHVYVWVQQPQQRARVGYSSPAGAPRAYALPYSNQLASSCLKAERTVAQSPPLGVRAYTRGKNAGKFHLYRLPPPILPRKERQ